MAEAARHAAQAVRAAPNVMRRKARHTLVYGLSADPAHQAHINLVVDAAKALIALGFDIVRILIIPVYRRNPVGAKHKDALPETFEHRFAMCQLAAREIGQRLAGQGGSVEVSRIEQKLVQFTERPNFTVETLHALQAGEAAGTDLILLLGSDLVSGDDPELGHWHQPEKLAQLGTLAIYPRPGHRSNEAFLKSLERTGAHFVHLDEVSQSDITARQIRERLETSDDPLVLSQEGLLTESVALYIKEHTLYRVSESRPGD